jgi:glycosyltransferase involved in cell wall biosynthesis
VDSPLLSARPQADAAQPAPWLSILLPVYKVEAYLEACAASILAQTEAQDGGSGVELIFVDDASPDGSAAVLRRLQAAHPAQVRVLSHQQNQGVSAARNTLLDAARGDYLWFIDPDDLLAPGAITALKEIITAQAPDQAPDAILCDFRSFEDSSGLAKHAHYQHIASFDGPSKQLCRDPSQLIEGWLSSGQLHPWSKIIRRSCWPTALRFPVGRVFEDLAVMPRLAMHLHSFYYQPQVWVAYRQRAGSALANLSAARLDDWMGALVGYANELRAAGLAQGAATQFVIAHYCARSFIRVAKRHTKLKQQDATTLARFAQQWRASSPLTAQALLSAYWRKGWWLRGLQFRYWLRRAGQ